MTCPFFVILINGTATKLSVQRKNLFDQKVVKSTLTEKKLNRPG